MTVYRKGFPTPKPVPRSPPAAEPPLRADPPPPSGRPAWLGNANSVEEYEYRRAVERAFRRQPPEPEPDEHDWVWS